MDNLLKYLSNNDLKGISISNKETRLDKLTFPLKLQTPFISKDSFGIVLDPLTKKDDLLYQGHEKLGLNFEDPVNFGSINHSEGIVIDNVKKDIEQMLSEDLTHKLNFECLKDLQEEFIEITGSFAYDDFKLVYPNSLASNLSFDPLTGELCEIISNVINLDDKAFSMESGHHEQNGRSSNNPKAIKTASLKNKTTLEGNSKILTNVNIENEKNKWAEILLQTSQEDNLIILTEQDLGEVLSLSTNMLEILNLADIQHEDENKELQKMELQYNHFWNSFSQHFETEEKKEAKEEVEEQAPPEDNLGFDRDFDAVAIKVELEKLPLPQSDGVDNEPKSGMQEAFEKGLVEGTPTSTTKHVSQTKSVRGNVSQYKWAIQDNMDLSNFYEILPRNRFAIQYPFELDDFQKRAVIHLENKESVFVAAHTSAGKTVVAEYAIALAKKHMTRAIYTSPIKALSNQKYRDFMSRFDSVGILTGDVSLKPEASCLIVTTEVLRSMLYKGSDIIKDIEWVIFDEVHYINNAERGVVWEETIIMLPPHIGIIMLSATVPNAMEFANWVGMTKQRKIFVQTTYKRPTPLEHSIYLNGVFQVIKPKDGAFNVNSYDKLIENMEKAKKDKDEFREKRKVELIEKFEEKGWKFKNDEKKKFFQKKQLDKAQKNKGVVNNNLNFKEQKAKEEKTRYYQMIRHFQKEKLLPCVLFAFSKKKCMELAFGLTGLELCDREERNRIAVFFNNAMKRLKPVDRDLPQLVKLKEILLKGVAVHHGDLLPIAKEVVEILFADGLVKVLFATETFAMGVNMPAKTVVFCGLKKSDGKEFRYLKSSEYTQMSGRAGRRGLDDKGNVVLFIRDFNDLPMGHDLKSIIDHKGESLESKFRLTYGIIFNLLLSREINVIDVMRRSFVEHDKVSSLPLLHKKLKDKKAQLISIKKEFKCKVMPYANPIPIEDYASFLEGLKSLAKDLWMHNSVFSKITFPKYARVLGAFGQMNIGIIIGTEKGPNGLVFKTFMGDVKQPVNKNDQAKLKIAYEEESKQSYGEMINDTSYKVHDIFPWEIVDIFNEKLDLGKFDMELKGRIKLDITEALKNNHEKVSKLKSDKDFLAYTIGSSIKNDKSVLNLYNNIQQTKKTIDQHACHSCDLKFVHFDMLDKINELEREIQDISKNVSEDNVAYMDQFEARIKILQELNYLDDKQNPLIKARIARELGSTDIFLCEVIMENVLIDLTPEEIAAVLSGFVCQVKRAEINFNDLLPGSLLDAMDEVQNICNKIFEREKENHITFDDEENYLTDKFNECLVKVVYEWACQKDFSEVCQLTDAQEGSIVRTILRLDILLRDLKSACKVMGNMKLHNLVDEASHLIRRDIVFAGSLYLE